MNIVHVVGGFLPGGAEILVKEISKQFKDLGHNVEIWAIYSAKDIFPYEVNLIEFEENYKKELMEAGISFKCVGRRPKKDRILCIKKFRQFKKQFKPDIIHVHLIGTSIYVVSAFLFDNIPIVETIHNVVLAWPKLIRFYTSKRVNKLIAISEKVREVLIENLKINPQKIELIYNGIDVSKFLALNYEVRKQVTNLLAIGRLVPQKDHFTLLKAFRLFIQKLQKQNIYEYPHLYIVGEGPLKNELYKMVKDLKIEGLVTFVGATPEVHKFLKKADIYVMSSIYEGLSISLIEALATGIPIIATNVGSNAEVVKHNETGILIPPRDPVYLAEALYLLYFDYEARKKFSRNAKVAAKKFDLTHIATTHIELYEKLVFNNAKK